MPIKAKKNLVRPDLPHRPPVQPHRAFFSFQGQPRTECEKQRVLQHDGASHADPAPGGLAHFFGAGVTVSGAGFFMNSFLT